MTQNHGGDEFHWGLLSGNEPNAQRQALVHLYSEPTAYSADKSSQSDSKKEQHEFHAGKS